MSNIKNNILEQKNERITSLFGARRTVTIQGTTINGHSGIDFVPEGWIITPEDGEVIAVKDSVSGVSVGTGNDFGNYVHLRVNERFVLRFCHLKQGAVVKVGQKLTQKPFTPTYNLAFAKSSGLFAIISLINRS